MFCLASVTSTRRLRNLIGLADGLFEDHWELAASLLHPELCAPPSPTDIMRMSNMVPYCVNEARYESCCALILPHLFLSGTSTLSPHFIYRLPSELIMMIFDELSDFEDAFSFGLTGSLFWSFGHHRILRLYAELVAPCTGHRLWCIGSLSTTLPAELYEPRVLSALDTARDEATCRLQYRDHLPEEYLWTDSEMDRYSSGWEDEPLVIPPDKKIKAILHHFRRSYRVADDLCPCRYSVTTPESVPLSISSVPGAMEWLHLLHDRTCQLRCYSRYSYEYDLSRREGEEVKWDSLKVPPKEDHEWDTEDEWSGSETDTSSNASNGSPSEHDDDEEVFVLRNLSRKMSVRSDTLKVLEEGVFCRLGRAVLIRICWSSDSNTTIKNNDVHRLHRGVWAGDCFDIVDLPMYEADVEKDKETGEDWLDVTRDVKKELISIWSDEFGEDWSKWW